MKRRYFFVSCIMLLIVLSTTNYSHTRSSFPPAGNTGSIGDGSSNTCGKIGCHSVPVNSGSGTLTINLSNIPSKGWAPGETYSIGVSMTEGGRATFGFQLTVEDGSGSKKGTFIGTSKVAIVNTAWPSHKGPSGTGTWTFDWIAPTDGTQQVAFWAAGLASNGNGQSSGDHVYTTNNTASRDLLARIEDIGIRKLHAVLNNPAQNILSVKAPKGSSVALYNLNGQRELKIYFSDEQMDFRVDHLKRGMYILTNESGTFARRIILN